MTAPDGPGRAPSAASHRQPQLTGVGGDIEKKQNKDLHGAAEPERSYLPQSEGCASSPAAGCREFDGAPLASIGYLCSLPLFALDFTRFFGWRFSRFHPRHSAVFPAKRLIALQKYFSLPAAPAIARSDERVSPPTPIRA
jgi:hypothetical protein